jgi:hypothetical protein
MSSRIMHYYLQGFAIVVSPNKVADCDIYFRSMGHSPQITGVDLYDKEKRYLGFVYPTNLDMAVKRAMLAYIKDHKKKWVRVFHKMPIASR